LRLSAVDMWLGFCYLPALNSEAHSLRVKGFCPFAAA